MTARELIVSALVLIAAAVALICALGAWRVRDDLSRIHTQAPLTAFCLPVVALALCIDAPFTPAMAKGLLLGMLALVLAPISSHALARAAHHRVEGPAPLPDPTEPEPPTQTPTPEDPEVASP